MLIHIRKINLYQLRQYKDLVMFKLYLIKYFSHKVISCFISFHNINRWPISSSGAARQRVSSLVTEPSRVISCQFAPASRHYEARARSKTVLKAFTNVYYHSALQIFKCVDGHFALPWQIEFGKLLAGKMVFTLGQSSVMFC